MNRSFLFYFWMCACLLVGKSFALTFEEAKEWMFANSPELAMAADATGAKEGLRRQTKLFPNPVLAYSAENVFGNKNWHDWNAAESRYELDQLIELGGKRGYRYTAAQYQLFASQANFDAVRQRLLNQLLKIYTEVAAAQEQVELAEEQTQIAEEVYRTVKTKVEAGKVSLIQQNKAEIALATAVIALEKARVDFASRKERLAFLWGESCPDFERVEFPFYEVSPFATLEQCIECLENHPDLLSAYFEYLTAEQNLHYEKAGAIPDLTLTVGYKTLQDTGNKGMIVGASLPLPIANRNQGNVQRAQYDMQKTQDGYIQQQLILENRLSLAHKELTRAYKEAELLRTTVLATAQKSFDYAKEGYMEGKFEYLDMLDSQKTLFEVKERYIQALLNYHKSRADIEYPTVGINS